jgi:methionyl-tRNA formyltransferase
MGTAELACPSLQALASDAHYEVVQVITQPDRPQGRDLKLKPSPVKEAALALGLDIFQPEKVRCVEARQIIASKKPDLIVVAAYGQILPQSLLDLPRLGCLNVHASLLPKHRGAAPIQWAILNDDSETGVTIMRVDAGLDTGDILTVEKTAILASDNAQTLHDRLALMGARLLLQTIPNYISGQIQPRPQTEDQASYARKITKQDGLIDWNLSAHQLWNRIRAFAPWPGAFSYIDGPSPIVIKIWEAIPVDAPARTPGEIISVDASAILVACGQQALRLTTLQREGKRRMPCSQFMAGFHLETGRRFTSSPSAKPQ